MSGPIISAWPRPGPPDLPHPEVPAGRPMTPADAYDILRFYLDHHASGGIGYIDLRTDEALEVLRGG